MKILGWKSFFALLSCAVCFTRAPGQTSVNAMCTLPAPAFATSAPDIFNDRQEQDLGDAGCGAPQSITPW
jgi:hypothetical protein